MLHLKNIAHFYGNRLIFKKIDLHIQAGVTLLIGANGTGKSTLLHIMAGLIQPSVGQVVMAQQARIGMVGHSTYLYPELTALENLTFWTKLHKEHCTHKEHMHMLERVSLAPFAHEKAGTFSRGMAQRLSLARTLLFKPDILLLDEPSTGLDVFSVEILQQEILDAATRGASIVWVSHSFETDKQFAPQLIFLQDKSLNYYGPTSSFNYASSILEKV